MSVHRPFNPVIGLLIIALVLIGFGYSFLENRGLEYYADHPAQILIVVGLSAFSATIMWYATRRLPRFLPSLQILSLGGLSSVFCAGSVWAAYATTARFWGNSENTEGYRWLAGAFALALGALTVATWRELKTIWRGFQEQGGIFQHPKED